MEFYIIILSATIGAIAFEISKKISEKNNTIPLTPVNAKNKETGSDMILVPLNNLNDAEGIKLPIGISSDFDIEDIEYINNTNAEFSFNILSIKGIDTENFTNYITEINWQYIINVVIDGIQYTDYIEKTTNFNKNDIGINFIEYQEITESDLINWISNNTNLNILKQKLEAKVISKSNSTLIKVLDLPYINNLQ
jgi:macrodomain Ter protein organizer (MatP/YcbG family)